MKSFSLFFFYNNIKIFIAAQRIIKRPVRVININKSLKNSQIYIVKSSKSILFRENLSLGLIEHKTQETGTSEMC